MRIHVVKWSLCGTLALGLCLLAGTSSYSADKAEVVAARQAVLDLAAGKGDPKDIAKKHQLEDVMTGFKLRSKGGIGFGPAAAPGPDGIEAKIIALSKRELPAEQLKKEAADIAKMIDNTKAIGEISAHYTDPAKKAPAKWKKFNDDMIQATKDVQDAVKGNNPAKVKIAIGKLSSSCNDCHTEFR